MCNYKKLDELKTKLDSFRPLPEEVVKNLHEDLVLRWTYNSNAIEGNTLTLKETKVALEGITIGGKTMREHFEAINHKEAILFVEDLVSKQTPLTESVIKSVHSLILKNIDDKNAGIYRSTNVIISGAEHTPSDALKVPGQMEALINWYNGEAQNLHPVEKASKLHVDFVKVHPFIDGNGRTARLLMNLVLMQNGFPPVVLSVENRLEYYEALDEAHTKNNYDRIYNLFIKICEESFLPYWHVLGAK